MKATQEGLEARSLDTGVGRIAYAVDVSHKGRPTVVLLHGLSGNHTIWLPTIAFFRALKLNIVLIDTRGHGDSNKTIERSRYRFTRLVDDILAILKKENIDQAILIGYSYGGSIAYAVAARSPQSVRGIVAISASHKNPLYYWHIGWLTPIVEAILESAAWVMQLYRPKTFADYDHTKVAGYWESVWDGWHTMPLSVNWWLLNEGVRLNLDRVMPDITAPILLVKSAHDPFLTNAEVSDIVKLVRTVTVVELSHKSHFVASEAQEELLAHIKLFLSEQTLV